MDSGYRYIVITGFMGTGKSVVGREVARRLGWPFVDMDEMIEKRAGKPIPRIFAEEGERAFREMEAALCQELSKQHDIVIATGGGTLIPPANREILSRHGLVVCLTCDFDELWQRLRDVTNRPMLYAEDRQARLKSLLDERASAYAAIPHQIDTTAIPVTEAAQRVISLWKRAYRILPVRAPEGQYSIHLGRGLLAEAGSLLRKAGLSGQAAVVSNPTVAALYADVLEASLQDADFRTARCLVPDGEAYKTLDTVRTLYDAFIEAGLARDSVVLALGGGVIGDAAGFAAATYMRGIPFVQIPTSLLAMVDSSVGGKVAVDHPRGKNLIGAFKQPDLVIADLDVLSTLPAAEYRSGLAEVIKHGIIASPELYACVEEGEAKLSPWAVAEAIHVKVEIVEEDPY